MALTYRLGTLIPELEDTQLGRLVLTLAAAVEAPTEARVHSEDSRTTRARSRGRSAGPAAARC